MGGELGGGECRTEIRWKSMERNRAMPPSHGPLQGDPVSRTRSCEFPQGLGSQVPRAKKEGMNARPITLLPGTL